MTPADNGTPADHGCSEEELIAFVSGELPERERTHFDEHLLGCEPCWRAVQEDRAGRLALEHLRVAPPHGLADRIRLAIELAADPEAPGPRHDRGGGRRDVARRQVRRARGMLPANASRRRVLGSRRRRVAATAVAGIVVLAAALGVSLGVLGGSVAGDPPAVAAVVAMASHESNPRTHLPGSTPEHLMLGGQPVMLRSFETGRVATLVATSMRPFTMPPSSHVVPGSSPSAWMATRGAVGLYCVNAPAGRESLLVAAPMPAVELPGMLDQLHLAPR